LISLATDSLNCLSLHLAKTSDSAPRRNGRGCAQLVCSSCNNLTAALAVPDACTRTLHGILPAECAPVCGVLRDLNLSEELTERGAVTGAVLARDSNLLSALAHLGLVLLSGCARARGERLSEERGRNSERQNGCDVRNIKSALIVTSCLQWTPKFTQPQGPIISMYRTVEFSNVTFANFKHPNGVIAEASDHHII